jgi:hypothetical protein
MGILADVSRRVAFDVVGAYEVSTVDLDNGVTMSGEIESVTSGRRSCSRARVSMRVLHASYESREDAMAGHARMVERVQRELL